MVGFQKQKPGTEGYGWLQMPRKEAHRQEGLGWGREKPVHPHSSNTYLCASQAQCWARNSVGNQTDVDLALPDHVLRLHFSKEKTDDRQVQVFALFGMVLFYKVSMNAE